jgi:hypothetical protein
MKQDEMLFTHTSWGSRAKEGCDTIIVWKASGAQKEKHK